MHYIMSSPLQKASETGEWSDLPRSHGQLRHRLAVGALSGCSEPRRAAGCDALDGKPMINLDGKEKEWEFQDPKHSHGIDGPFIDGLPIKNSDFP